MKEILIGKPRTGKTSKYIVEKINNYEGRIIFISKLDELGYLKINKKFEKTSDFRGDSLSKHLIDSKSNIHFTCKTRQDCFNLFFVIEHIPQINNEKVLVIIDEGMSILSEFEFNIFSKFMYSKTDFYITLLDDGYLHKFIYKEEFEAFKLELLDIWKIENIN